MHYESTITFTLDTICPWTYLGYVRLQKALAQFLKSEASAKVTFTLKFAPYQLYPEFSAEGEDKHEWYKKKRYNDDEERVRKYERYMAALGTAEGITIDLTGGPIANTLQAHRILWYFQEERGSEAASKVLESLYSQYFSKKAHPSHRSTLLAACMDAGMDENKAKELIEDESEALMDVKEMIREQTGNGIDSVPHVVFEGRRRDFTEVGAKEVDEYLRSMKQVAKEV